MSGLDFSKLTDQQLLSLKAAGGDLSKLSNDDLMSIHSTLNPSLGRRMLNAAGDVASEVGDFTKRAGEYRDTQFAKAMSGIAGLPKATADAADWAVSKLGLPAGSTDYLPAIGPAIAVGRMMPTSDQVYQSVKMPGQAERGINPVIDAGVQSVIGGPVMGVAGKLGPLVNFGAGAGSELAGRVAHEYLPNYETPIRIAGAILGGGSGAGVGKAATKAASVVKAGSAPFTEGGRDAIVGDALNRVASDPTKAATALESYQAGRDAFPSSVPGFRVDAGKASRDPGLMAAAETVPQGMRGPVVQENNRIVTDALNRTTHGLPDPGLAGSIIQNELGQTVEGLKGVRAMETGPLYDAARKSPAPLKPFPLLTYTADAVAANKGEPAAVMQKARNLLFTTDKNGRTIADRSSRGMMATRDALNDMLSNQELGQYSRSLLQEMKGKVDEALNAVPQAKVANQRFAELSKNLEPFNPDLGDLNKTLGGVIERNQYNSGYTMPAEKVPSQLMKGGDLSAPMVQHLINASGGNPAVKKALASAYLEDFRKSATAPVAGDAAGNPMVTAAGTARWLEKHGAGAANVLTPEQIGALRDISKNLGNQAQTVPGRTGSPTFDRLATESIVGALVSPRLADAPFLYPVKRTLGLVYGGANEAVQARLYEALQDPAVAKALMRKATPQNVSLAEPILRKISAAAAVPASKERQ